MGTNFKPYYAMEWTCRSTAREAAAEGARPPGATGYMYVLDRVTGQVLSAKEFVRITAALGVDLKTRRLMPNAENEPVTGKAVRDIAPVAPGAKDWQPLAYSPRTGLLYVPHQHLTMGESIETGYIAGRRTWVRTRPQPGGSCATRTCRRRRRRPTGSAWWT